MQIHCLRRWFNNNLTMGGGVMFDRNTLTYTDLSLSVTVRLSRDTAYCTQSTVLPAPTRHRRHACIKMRTALAHTGVCLHPPLRHHNILATRGARSARADARLCTSSGINLIVPLSFHLVR